MTTGGAHIDCVEAFHFHQMLKESGVISVNHALVGAAGHGELNVSLPEVDWSLEGTPLWWRKCRGRRVQLVLSHLGCPGASVEESGGGLMKDAVGVIREAGIFLTKALNLLRDQSERVDVSDLAGTTTFAGLKDMDGDAKERHVVFKDPGVLEVVAIARKTNPVQRRQIVVLGGVRKDRVLH